MGFAAEALLGRRNRGGGRPVRLRSTPSGLPSGGPEGVLTAREPFMMDEWALSRQEEMQRGALRGTRSPTHRLQLELGKPRTPGLLPPSSLGSLQSPHPKNRACDRAGFRAVNGKDEASRGALPEGGLAAGSPGWAPALSPTPHPQTGAPPPV